MDRSELLIRGNYNIEAEQPEGDEAPSRAFVLFNSPLETNEWGELQQSLVEFLEIGMTDWVLDLRKLEEVFSVDLGMYVAANAAVESRGGKLHIQVDEDSKVHKLLVLTKLDQILKILPA